MNFEHPLEVAEDVTMNMTPMIDVVFLLVIFFLAAAQLSVGGERDVELPLASEARPASRLNPDSITIDVQALPGGPAFAVSGHGYSYGTLLKNLRNQVELARITERDAPPVILRVDYRVPYEHVQKLLWDCASMGIHRFDFETLTGGENRS